MSESLFRNVGNQFDNFVAVEFTSDEIFMEILNSSGIWVKNCPSIENGIEMITKYWFVDQIKQSLCTFIVRLEIQTKFEAPTCTSILKIFNNYNRNFFIVLFGNSVSGSQILWKFWDQRTFCLKVEPNLTDYVMNFLASSIKKDEVSGISLDTIISLNSQQDQDIYELDVLSLADSRDYNLLMLASENGDANSVKLLLTYCFDVDTLIYEKSAIDLAWENHHYDVVLLLLEANSMYPKNFNNNNATDAIKMLGCDTHIIHNYIITCKVENEEKNFLEKIGNILVKYPNLRHFYSTKHVSAPALALLKKKILIYEFLVTRNVYIGPKEDFNKILKELNGNFCENVRGIHLKIIKPLTSKYLMILIANSFIGHDNQNDDKKLRNVREAFEFLDKIHPLISLILKTVAESRDFKIIFDFHRIAIQYLDPTSKKHIKGIFYTTRHIYIAAKEMLDPGTKLITYGIIAHELCHYALLLVYRNNCKPYFSFENDNEKDIKEEITKQKLQKMRFTTIALICLTKSDEEDLIKSAYENYESNKHHAELAVRVSHMIVEYSNDEDRLKSRRELFPELFAFTEEVIAADMKKALPDIEVKADEKIQKYAHRVKKQEAKILWLWIFVGVLMLLLPLTFCLMMMFNPVGYLAINEKIYSCENLTDELRMKIFNSTVDFQGVLVSFEDLFGDDPAACDVLSTEDIRMMLKAFSANTLFNESNPGKLDNNRTFYNKFDESFEIKSECTASQTIPILKSNEPALKIGEKVEIKTKFYTNRKFLIDVDILDKNGAFYLDYSNKYKNRDKIVISRADSIKLKFKFNFGPFLYIDLSKLPIQELNSSKKFSAFFSQESLKIVIWDKIDDLNLEDFNKAIELIKLNSEQAKNYQWIMSDIYEQKLLEFFETYGNGTPSCNEQNVIKFTRNIKNIYKFSLKISKYSIAFHNVDTFEQSINLLFHKINKNRVHLLADTAGSGKSTTFRHMTKQMKQNLPLFWVSYVGLKDYIEIFQNFSTFDSNISNLADFIGSKILNLTSDAEWNIFRIKFTKNESIFFWDAIDEVSPKCFEQVTQLIEAIFKLTGNHQWISTRPQHQQEIAKMFIIPIMKLMPYDKNDQRIFIDKFLKYYNISTVEATGKIEKFLVRLEKGSNFTEMVKSPQMLFMICKSFKKGFSLNDSTNLYQFYESYILTLFKEAPEKGAYVTEDINYINIKELFKETHQHYALKEIFSASQNFKEHETSLTILRNNYSQIAPRITRYGILFYNQHGKHGELEFEHRTFAEYFVAQYFLDNVWNPRSNPTAGDIQILLDLLFRFLDKKEKYEIILNFIDGFLDILVDVEKKFDQSFINAVIKKCENFIHFSIFKVRFLTKIFKKEPIIIEKFWKIDKNKSFFHEYLIRHPGIDNYKKMTEVVENIFSEENQKTIFVGKFQNLSIIMRIWKNDYSCSITKHLKEDCKKIKNLKNETQILDFIAAKKFSQAHFHEHFLEFESELYRTMDKSNLSFRVIWKIIDENVDKMEITSSLLKHEKQISSTFFNVVNKDENFILTFFTIIKNYIPREKIVNYLLSLDINHVAYFTLTLMDFKVIKNFWDFIEEYLNYTQKRELVRPVIPNMLSKMLYYKNEELFNFYRNNIKKLFSKSELQSFMVSLFPIKVFLGNIDHSEFDQNSCIQFAEFIKETFEGNHEEFVKFFKNRIEFTKCDKQNK